MAHEEWHLAYRDKFRSVFNEEFQSWIETLLRALHVSGDFQSIRRTSGDGGLDGFVINSRLVYQVYAPARIKDLRDGETATKIRHDFATAQVTLKGAMREWTFIHNHPEGKIGQLSADALSLIKRNNPGITLRVLDVNSLWREIETVPEARLKTLFESTIIKLPTVVSLGAESRAAVDPHTHKSGRPEFIFLQFLNPEIRDLYNLNASWSNQRLRSEWIRIARYALLVGERGLAIPASYIFEVPEMDGLLDDLKAVRNQGLLHIASPTPNLPLYAGSKRKEYRDELPLLQCYETEDELEPEKGQLVWVPRLKRSASGDIAGAWRTELWSSDGLWHDLLKSSESRQLRLPSLVESAIHSVPDRLDGRAFIYRFAEPLLPFVPDPTGGMKLKLLISREYLRSYLLELRAAVLIETPIGSLDCGIEKYSASGDLQTISWRALADCFETLRIRSHVEALSWRDLLRLRTQPFLHWLIQMVLTPTPAGRNAFEEVVNLSHFRAPEPRSRTRNRRTFDIVMDQISRFQTSADPVLSSYDWSELALQGPLRTPVPRKQKRRSVSPSIQMTLLPETCDVGIVIALAEEFREMQRQLGDRWKPLYDDETATDYYLFTMEGPDGAAPYTCVTTFAGSMGATKAALLTEKLRSRWQVRVLVNVGIAGALDKDVHIGDVVAGSVADNYLERARAVELTGNRFDFVLAGEPFRSSRTLVDACAHLEFAHPKLLMNWRQSCQSFLGRLPAEEHDRLRASKFLNAAPEFMYGHIACGPSVGASIAFKDWLKERDRSYLTLDMESGGVLWAVYEAARATEGLVLRGVSDFADERKPELDAIGKGELRRYAMNNALHFLWALMSAGRFPRTDDAKRC